MPRWRVGVGEDVLLRVNGRVWTQRLFGRCTQSRSHLKFVALRMARFRSGPMTDTGLHCALDSAVIVAPFDRLVLTREACSYDAWIPKKELVASLNVLFHATYWGRISRVLFKWNGTASQL